MDILREYALVDATASCVPASSADVSVTSASTNSITTCGVNWSSITLACKRCLNCVFKLGGETTYLVQRSVDAVNSMVGSRVVEK